jgi:hypothetical protein
MRKRRGSRSFTTHLSLPSLLLLPSSGLRCRPPCVIFVSMCCRVICGLETSRQVHATSARFSSFVHSYALNPSELMENRRVSLAHHPPCTKRCSASPPTLPPRHIAFGPPAPAATFPLPLPRWSSALSSHPAHAIPATTQTTKTSPDTFTSSTYPNRCSMH